MVAADLTVFLTTTQLHKLSWRKHGHLVAICLFMYVLVMLHRLLRLFMKPCAVSPGGQSKGKHKAQGQERLGSYKQTHLT